MYWNGCLITDYTRRVNKKVSAFSTHDFRVKILWNSFSLCNLSSYEYLTVYFQSVDVLKRLVLNPERTLDFSYEAPSQCFTIPEKTNALNPMIRIPHGKF